MDKILIIEDNESIVEGLTPSLQLNHFEVTHALDAKTGRNLASKGDFSLVILDINLPDGNGLDLCQEIHDAFPTIPVIMLTARDEEKTVVEGFARGATDYVRKPFGTGELVARIRAALSRHVKQSGEVRYGKLMVETNLRTANYDGTPMELTKREFDVLALLVKRAGGAVTRDEIISLMDDDNEMLDRTVDSHISHLRKKIKALAGDKLSLKALYGVGYRLEMA